MKMMQSIIRATLLGVLASGVGNQVAAQDSPTGDSAHGKTFFETSCAICHTASLGPGNTVIVKQGPSLVGVVGRRAGSGLVSITRKP